MPNRNPRLLERVIVPVIVAIIGTLGAITEKPHPGTGSIDGELVGFGEWKAFEANVVYKADSDGFVAAFTHGTNITNNLRIRVGGAPTTMERRTRAGKWDGTVCPVPRGHYWKVETKGHGEIVVHWLPVGHSRMSP